MSSVTSVWREANEILHTENVRSKLQALHQAGDLAGAAQLADRTLARSSALQSLRQQLCDPNVLHVAKDEALAVQLKDTGATLFSKGHYAAASIKYSEALVYLRVCSPATKELAATVLCNRALCLLRASPPNAAAALSDCQEALDLNPHSTKAWYRQSQALSELGRAAEARQSAHEALKQCTASSTTAKQVAELLQRLDLVHVRDNTSEVEPRSRQGAGKAGDQIRDSQPGICESKGDASERRSCQGADNVMASERLPQGSQPCQDAPKGSSPAKDTSQQTNKQPADALSTQIGPKVSIERTKEEGRHLVASRDLETGETVLAEVSFACTISKAHRSKLCWRCLHPLDPTTSVACGGCAVARYCSRECRIADHQHRGPLCGVAWPLVLPQDTVLACTIIAKIAQRADGAHEVAQLQTHFQALSLDELIGLLPLACFAAACWNACARGTEPDSCGDPNTTSPTLQAEDVLKAQCQILINGIAIVPEKHSAGAEDRIALAIYPKASLLNHACIPNVAFTFAGSFLRITAAENLHQGEPLYHCYGPQVGEMTTEQRQWLLQRQYRFTCRCLSCMRPPSSELGMTALKCPGCSGPVRPQQATPAGVCALYELPAGSGRCSSCGQVMDSASLDQALSILAEAKRHWEQANELMIQSSEGQGAAQDAGGAARRHAHAERLFASTLSAQERLLHESNQLPGRTHDALARCLLQSGARREAKQHAQAALRIVAANYPAESTVVATQRLLYADLGIE